jgi:membrane-bound metal-dependent hydrolase YbcI (DUF457 family)
VNLPLIFALSVLPDVDILFESELMHRGATHSLVMISLLMVPFFVVYRKRAAPYFAVLLSHILVGDFITGGAELFWPLTHQTFGFFLLRIPSLSLSVVEFALFLVAAALLFKTGDLKRLVKFNKMSWVLVVPSVTVLGSMANSGMLKETALLLFVGVPSVFFLILFGIALLVWFGGILSTSYKKLTGNKQPLPNG